jgi:prepilin-type N-terminal cleavage/methylation domain-containing protein
MVLSSHSRHDSSPKEAEGWRVRRSDLLVGRLVSRRLRGSEALRKPSASLGFTLIELLVVIAIIAILSVVVILTLNPSQLLQQGRDSDRVSDMATLNTALGVYAAGGGTSFGSSSVIYVSIPDPSATSTAGDQCQGLGLPSLPSTYSYHCAASSTLRSTDATGWIPINFSSIALGSTLGSLPIDPLNQSSSRLYYTYTTNGTQYEVTSAMESAKYKLGGSNDVIGTDGSTLSTVYAKGSNLSLEPLDYGDSSLVGYWPLTEGTGTIAYDYSGNNATGSWNGTQAGSSGYYSAGKIGPYAGAFDGSTDYVSIPNSATFNNWTAQSISLWIKATYGTEPIAGRIIEKGANNEWTIAWGGSGNNYVVVQPIGNSGNLFFSTIPVADGTWHNIVIIISPTYYVSLYIDGVLNNSAQSSAPPSKTNAINISAYGGGGYHMAGLIDDIRIYNRVLSASEIAAMYAGGK